MTIKTWAIADDISDEQIIAEASDSFFCKRQFLGEAADYWSSVLAEAFPYMADYDLWYMASDSHVTTLKDKMKELLVKKARDRITAASRLQLKEWGLEEYEQVSN